MVFTCVEDLFHCKNTLKRKKKKKEFSGKGKRFILNECQAEVGGDRDVVRSEKHWNKETLDKVLENLYEVDIFCIHFYKTHEKKGSKRDKESSARVKVPPLTEM